MQISVCMVTYNHAKYIAQAIDSVLMQRGNFEIELVIGEDCSTDNTREIIIDKWKSNKNHIKLILGETNIGVNHNYVRTLQNCSGQYIAMLDGDDFWTSSDKLQTQLKYLEAKPDCAICYHNAAIVEEDGNTLIRYAVPSGQKEITSIEELVIRNFLPNCTVFFRNGFMVDYPQDFFNLSMADWPIHVLTAQYGNIGYIDRVMANYRKHPEGIYSGINYIEEMQNWILVQAKINQFLDYRYANIIEPSLADRWEKLIVLVIESGFQLGCNSPEIDNIKTIFNNWPSDLELDHTQRNNIFIQIYERLLFHFFHLHQTDETKYCLLRLFYLKPSLIFTNRGIGSLLFRIVFSKIK